MIDNFSKEPDVLEAINNDNKIEAIKLLRVSRGIGLKEAKDLVDQYEQAHGLSDVSNNSSASGSESNLKWIIVVALATLGFYIFRNYF